MIFVKKCLSMEESSRLLGKNDLAPQNQTKNEQPQVMLAILTLLRYYEISPQHCAEALEGEPLAGLQRRGCSSDMESMKMKPT